MKDELTWEELRASMHISKEMEAEIEQEGRIIDFAMKVRKSKGLTQKELAELCNVAQPEIARFEKHKHSPRLDTVKKILNSLGYTLAIVPLEKDEGECKKNANSI